ncbi:hypothetical protein ACIWO4_09415 [Avibacterium paragallinarum]|uniref:hypothetical protein n=1 Tax=Avibacterium paragallinarum TaxID=728 RepID=UPI0039882C41
MFPIDNVRNENIVFEELKQLCQQPGYAHIVASFCFRDNSVFSSSDEVTADDILGQYNEYRVIRNEISLLIGLMCQKTLDLTIPKPELFQATIDKTEYLLEELHLSMMKTNLPSENCLNSIDKFQEYMRSGQMLREPIFYSERIRISFPI